MRASVIGTLVVVVVGGNVEVVGASVDEDVTRAPDPTGDCATGDDDAEGLDHDQKVEHRRAPLQVVEIEAELPGRAELGPGVAAANLRPARETGLDQVAPVVVRVFLFEAIDDLADLGARPDEAHVAAHDVPQLR